jgi:hypothetical protein|tara:strand:+ start:7766 stop:8161 length:396 start_codon:yes stop_codon:yes gene_type:complete
MSHFSKIQTSLKDLDLLKKSLSDLSIQWEPELNRVRGYKDQTTFANLVIRQDNNYDIGFSWNGFEYQLVADIQFWQQPWSIELFLDRVSQKYAYNSIVESTSKQGFQTVNETVQEDGSIKLTLQKWNSNLV